MQASQVSGRPWENRFGDRQTVPTRLTAGQPPTGWLVRLPRKTAGCVANVPTDDFERAVGSDTSLITALASRGALAHPCHGPMRVAQELMLRGIPGLLRRRARGLAAWTLRRPTVAVA